MVKEVILLNGVLSENEMFTNTNYNKDGIE